ncbi:MAG: tRNA epoxyqueuosine(34) reductase QueG [Cytophagales bacterium]|nr:tRNA epoxyqueuosine(34) reductase QueG [Cytophagales bacterium]
MARSSKEKYTKLIKRIAKSLNFDYCGISKAEKLTEEEALLESWLSMGYHGKMSYMENHFDIRLDPTKLVPGAKSVISLLYNYYPEEDDPNTAYKISKYAFGKDYHLVIRNKLKAFLEILRHEAGEINGRVFVDSAPVMERQWAAKSGLGWLGKNTLLINKEKGSYFFLAELIIDLELEYDGPIRDYCGACTRCLDACPTDAFVGARLLDASKCISYLTIELKEAIPEEFKDTYEKWVFGCDICQEVCPWNRFSVRHEEPAFNISEGVKSILKGDWEDVTEELFNSVFKDSPIKRTKFKGLKRNIDFIRKKSR